jgi:hypothetical protein
MQMFRKSGRVSKILKMQRMTGETGLGQDPKSSGGGQGLDWASVAEDEIVSLNGAENAGVLASMNEYTM